MLAIVILCLKSLIIVCLILGMYKRQSSYTKVLTASQYERRQEERSVSAARESLLQKLTTEVLP